MKYVYLDYAAGWPIDIAEPTTYSISERSIYANAASIHDYGVNSQSIINEARKTISNILNSHSQEIYFMPNSTYSIATALTAASQGLIITSNIEHNAVLQNLINYKHLILKVESNGILKPHTLRQALDDLDPLLFRESMNAANPRILVTIMYANNEIGTIQESKKYGHIIDEYNRKMKLNNNNRILYHIDASQASAYLDLDIRKLRCDLLTLNSSKCGGPYGIALLYAKEDIRNSLTPLIRGGDQERGLYSGTHNVLAIRDFAIALQRTQNRRESESERLTVIRDSFINKILQHNGFTVYGSIERDERLPNNINLRVPGVESDEMVIRLNQRGYMISHGSACKALGGLEEDNYVLQALGASHDESRQNIRISMGPDTTATDMDNLYENIIDIQNKFAKE